MIFALLTLLSALSLAAVAGWFSIVGFMAIYAGAPMYALIMGVVTEAAKLVTTSWLYRNWDHASWKLKAPLLYFTIALMVATSIGVFGFLSKAHLEQTAGTLDNSSKIESLNYQIDREKAIVADNEKVIAQLDATVNSFLGKDRADRSLSVRKSQAPQRKQLRDDIAASQKRIDELNAEKFKLESEVRALQLEVGPIRYIAELIYGVEENSNKNIEAAVRIFTLLLVSTLDPLAVILLIAANHTLIRLRNEKNKKTEEEEPRGPDNNPRGTSQSEPFSGKEAYTDTKEPVIPDYTEKIAEARSIIEEEAKIPAPLPEAPVGLLNEEETIVAKDIKDNAIHEVVPPLPIDVQTVPEIEELPADRTLDIEPTELQRTIQVEEIKDDTLEKFFSVPKNIPVSFVRSPGPTKVVEQDVVVPPTDPEPPVTTQQTITPWAQQETVLRELLGATPHFVPKKVNEEETPEGLATKDAKIQPQTDTSDSSQTESHTEEVYQGSPPEDTETGDDTSDSSVEIRDSDPSAADKYPKALSWLREFKGPENER